MAKASSTSFPANQMQWCPPPMMPTYLIWDPYHQIWVNYPSMMPINPWGWGGHLTDRFSKGWSFWQMTELIHPPVKKIEPINEENVVLKSEIERTTTTGDVIQIDTSQVKLGKEFNRPIVINDQANTDMEDVAQDREEEKTDNVVDSKYLQPRWCPPNLTRTQKHKLRQLRLVEMREKEREKWWDELFHEIKPRTLPKQEWKRKEAPRGAMAEPAADGQTVMPDGPSTTGSRPCGSIAPSSS
jgi:hypothetical protein